MADLAIIGAGPGGYTAALYAAIKGLSVILFEKEHVGGTCLNWGCIPTKSLLASSQLYQKILDSAKFGIKVDKTEIDFETVFNRKDDIVKSLRSGIELLIKKRKINLIRGEAILEENSTILCNGEVYKADNIIIATGSSPMELKGMKTDGKFILNSTHALELKDIPQNILIVGGGVIGVEFASLWQGFGKNVTIIEIAENILPMADIDIVKRLRTMLKKQGIKIITGKAVDNINVLNEKVIVKINDKSEMEFDKVLIAAGRSLNLKNIKLKLEKNNNLIKVDSRMMTDKKNIYAIGDIVSKYQLAHVASSQALIAVNNILGEECHFSEKAIPSCIYTHPEAAWVGMTEKQVDDMENGKYNKGVFRFNALGKALAIGENEGFVKILSDENDNILGIHMLGPKVTELISEAVTAIATRLKVYEWSSVIHAHPTLSEAVMEAVHDVHGECVYNL
ncbi:MAG: dihydrolipoyl dehydrogenase [Candidatus Muirbacterium halophilum]|nr:dihydrolipoyl dehydrogenase [Candidatus Muirbacterium halophilum]